MTRDGVGVQSGSGPGSRVPSGAREAHRGFSREPHRITDVTYSSDMSQQGKGFESPLPGGRPVPGGQRAPHVGIRIPRLSSSISGWR